MALVKSTHPQVVIAMISVKNALSSILKVSESAKRPTRDEVQAFIFKQAGLSLEPCNQLKPSRGYYNFKLKNRASESEELEVLLRLLPRQSLIKRVEPNGAQRIAVFV